jgi:hypothetical protein
VRKFVPVPRTAPLAVELDRVPVPGASDDMVPPPVPELGVYSEEKQ